ncbi:nicotinamide riboside transporter PnuC [Gordonia insulae]|uniref:Nicotinamide riboside transporter PnuC n=1 Tax=Gordonia insulae TaxID=2420509 RepID=A0A3G8JN93_9ACTN|nr:nicotinamide riboside transporter PnuC [Gordonia insulae]AZG46453.1 Nicotinamide riboside transporter PnuC [Gordonia insulae]
MLSWLTGHWSEVLGFVTGAGCVILAARRNILTFPLGIANNLVFIVLFSANGLYANVGLQALFLVLGIHGWSNWHRSRTRPAFASHTPRSAIGVLVIAAVAMTGLLYLVLRVRGESTLPIADAATTAVSLTAQYMLNRRWLENWLVWIAVDVAYVVLFWSTGLPITALLYLLFIGLCIHGYVGWRPTLLTSAPTTVIDTPAARDA